MVNAQLWVLCPSCAHVLYRPILSSNGDICPKCQYHFRLSTAERLQSIADEGTFREMFQDLAPVNFLHFHEYDQKLQKSQAKTHQLDGILTGVVRMEGHACALAIMEFDFMGGSVGSVMGEKLYLLVQHATHAKLPLVIVTASGGMRMQEGAVALMQMAKISVALQTFMSHGGLYLAVLTDPTAGGVTASFAMQADHILAEAGANIIFTGRRVIEQTIGENLPDNFQSAEQVWKRGFVDKVLPRSEIKPKLAQLMRLMVGTDGAV